MEQDGKVRIEADKENQKVNYSKGMLLEVTNRSFEIKNRMTYDQQKDWLSAKSTWHDDAGEPWILPVWDYTHIEVGTKVLVMNTRPGVSRHIEVMAGNLVGLVERRVLKHYSKLVTE